MGVNGNWAFWGSRFGAIWGSVFGAFWETDHHFRAVVSHAGKIAWQNIERSADFSGFRLSSNS